MNQDLIEARIEALRRRSSLLGAAVQAVWSPLARRVGEFLREVEGVQNGRGCR